MGQSRPGEGGGAGPSHQDVQPAEPQNAEPAAWSSGLPGLVPNPYNEPEAVNTTCTVAAPLLGGFGLTLIGLILQEPDRLGLPDQTLFLLAGAVVAFIMVVQCGFWARQYAVTVDQAAAWWWDEVTRRPQVEWEVVAHLALYRRWADRARRTYAVAILLLMLGLAIALVPPGATFLRGPINMWRTAAIVVVLAGFGLECLWLCANWFRSPRGARQDPGRLTRLSRRISPVLVYGPPPKVTDGGSSGPAANPPEPLPSDQ